MHFILNLSPTSKSRHVCMINSQSRSVERYVMKSKVSKWTGAPLQDIVFTCVLLQVCARPWPAPAVMCQWVKPVAPWGWCQGPWWMTSLTTAIHMSTNQRYVCTHPLLVLRRWDDFTRVSHHKNALRSVSEFLIYSVFVMFKMIKPNNPKDANYISHPFNRLLVLISSFVIKMTNQMTS